MIKARESPSGMSNKSVARLLMDHVLDVSSAEWSLLIHKLLAFSATN